MLTQEQLREAELIKVEPTHAELANAATKTCYCRTGADGWIFANTTQLLEFIRDVQKS